MAFRPGREQKIIIGLLVAQVIGFIMFCSSIGLADWIYYDTNSTTIFVGLWKDCIEVGKHQKSTCVQYDNDQEGSLKGAGVLECFALLGTMATVGLTVPLLSDTYRSYFRRCAGYVGITTGFLGLLGAAVVAASETAWHPAGTLSYAFYLNIFSDLAFFIVGTILTFRGPVMQHEELANI